MTLPTPLPTTLPSPPQPFQRPMINGPDVGVYSNRDIHAERGVTFWPVDPPQIPELALAISGRTLPPRWVIHYDNLVYGVPSSRQHAATSGYTGVRYGVVCERGDTARTALTTFLAREIMVYNGIRQHVSSFAEGTHVLGVQPVGVPYLRLLLPANFFLARDSTGYQRIILPTQTPPSSPPSSRVAP